ncbi:type II secretion system protein [Candidatus Parcubacteria bacterium]|nr:type II secretion system protein [Candidatus Parcubacteria bacterium]
MRNKAFTLIELLVVISIVSLLSSVVISELNKSRNEAKMKVSLEKVRILRDNIIIAQGNTGNTLRQITGSGCSRCHSSCSNTDLKNVSTECYSRWVNAVDDIFNVSGEIYRSSKESLYRDAWGSPFILDENEGEVSTAYCRRDTLNIVGPDGVYNTSDDIRINLPYTGYGQKICDN